MQTTIGKLLQRVIALHKQGGFEEVALLYQRILEYRPDYPDANHNLGILKVTSGSINDALPLFERAIDVKPQIEQFWFSYIEALVGAGCLDDAKILLENAKQSLASTQNFGTFVARLSKEFEISAPFLPIPMSAPVLTGAPRSLSGHPTMSVRTGDK